MSLEATEIPGDVSAGWRLVANPNVLCRKLQDEMVLLNLDTEAYLGLDESGTAFWEALTTAPSAAKAFEKLLGEFEVEPSTLKRDVLEFAGRLVTEGLATVAPTSV